MFCKSSKNGTNSFHRGGQNVHFFKTVVWIACQFPSPRSSLLFSRAQREFQFSLDGVLLTVPAEGFIARENCLRTGDTKLRRKKSEVALPAGHDRYNKQVPNNRLMPLWGGISWGGFGLVVQHFNLKATADDWVGAVEDGHLLKI